MFRSLKHKKRKVSNNMKCTITKGKITASLLRIDCFCIFAKDIDFRVDFHHFCIFEALEISSVYL